MKKILTMGMIAIITSIVITIFGHAMGWAREAPAMTIIFAGVVVSIIGTKRIFSNMPPFSIFYVANVAAGIVIAPLLVIATILVPFLAFFVAKNLRIKYWGALSILLGEEVVIWMILYHGPKLI